MVKFACSIVVAMLATMPGLGRAAAPELKVSKSVIVHAAPGPVWERIKNFGTLDGWHPGVARDEIVAGSGNAVGSERRITLASGAVFTEKLVGFDARHHRYRTAMLGGTLPVSGYLSVISIKAAGKNRSKVTWSGKFKRKDAGANPAAAANDAAATAAISAFYQAGLENLKKIIVEK